MTAAAPRSAGRSPDPADTVSGPAFAGRSRDPMAPPGLWRLMLEGRAVWEAGASLMLWPVLARGARGDGHPVLVLPGLVASNRSTRMLRRYLEGRGWQAHGWHQGRNLGPRAGVFEGIQQQLEQLTEQTGRRVSLVGWSLGGVFARELAKRMPASVRQVVTLGSPVQGHSSATRARRVYEWAAGHRAYAADVMERLHEPVPPTIPCTSIYSRSDGIVHWRASLQPDGPLHQNIRVPASHTGMGFNPLVLHVLADRLAQPEEGWQPYRGLFDLR